MDKQEVGILAVRIRDKLYRLFTVFRPLAALPRPYHSRRMKLSEKGIEGIRSVDGRGCGRGERLNSTN